MNEEKKIDANLIGNIPEFNLSTDFTDKVMGKIEGSTKSSKLTVYKPVISRPVLYLIGVSILAVLVFSFFTTESSTVLDPKYILSMEKITKNFQVFSSPLVAISFLSILALLVFEKFMGRFVSV